MIAFVVSLFNFVSLSVGCKLQLVMSSVHPHLAATHQDCKELVLVANGAVSVLAQKGTIIKIQVQLVVELIAVIDLQEPVHTRNSAVILVVRHLWHQSMLGMMQLTAVTPQSVFC